MGKGRGGFQGGIPGNMNNLMKQAQRMQRQMEEKQKELETKTWEATSGGGAVSVVMNSDHVLQSVKIKPEVVDPEDVEMLEDLVLTAVNEASKMVEEETSASMGALTGGLGGLGGFGL